MLPVTKLTAAAMELTSNRDLRNYYFRSYVFRSIYHDQVKRWMTTFPANQLLILQSERLFAEPARSHVKSQFISGPCRVWISQPVPRLEKIWGGGVTRALKKAAELQGH